MTKKCINFCLNYGGQAEIVDAVKRIVKEGVDVDTLDIEISSIEKEIEQRRRHEAILRKLKSEENWLKSNLKINGGQ